MPESLETPVLLVIFNRPDLTARAMEILRRIQPRRLFIAADGPRRDRPGEAEACAQTREVVDHVDWCCEVVRDYAEDNMGCGRRVSSGITWVFEHVEAAIILEDDCLPSPSFFRFCGELLDRYRDDNKIMHIGGSNMVPHGMSGKASYRFSKYPHIWGWATWKRAWARYDFGMSAWHDYRRSKAFVQRCPNRDERAYWTWYFDLMTGPNPADTWDYQWQFACWLHNGLAISPSVNLVTNAGFRSDGTHTKADSPWANMPAFEIGEMVPPPRVEADRRADWWEFVHHYGGEWYREQTRPMNRLRRYLRPLRSAAKRLVRR